MTTATVDACPGCALVPAYREVRADPWDRHETCPGCGHCYTHNGPPVARTDWSRLPALVMRAGEDYRGSYVAPAGEVCDACGHVMAPDSDCYRGPYGDTVCIPCGLTG